MHDCDEVGSWYSLKAHAIGSHAVHHMATGQQPNQLHHHQSTGLQAHLVHPGSLSRSGAASLASIVFDVSYCDRTRHVV